MTTAKKDAQYGAPWTADELDVILADYFSMLSDDLSGKHYVKSKHSATLMVVLGRSHRSVEFKHQNISAVLDELGLPWIPGYKPKANYQSAIFDAVDRYLSQHSEFLLQVAQPPTELPDTAVFVDSPPLLISRSERPDSLRRLVAKFDPVKRDYANRTLARAGEQLVFDIEQRRLTEVARNDLAERVRWTAEKDGDGAGYDIDSFDWNGERKLIEVKTTNGSIRTPFFLTRNECNVAENNPDVWLIYRVHLFSSGPRIFTIAPPLSSRLKLTPETWKASF